MQPIKLFQSPKFLRFLEVSNRIGFYLLVIFIFLNPVPHSTTYKELCIYLAFFFFFCRIVSGNHRLDFKIPLLIPLFIFFGWSLISMIFSLDPLNSLHDILYHLFKFIFLFYVLVFVFADKQRFRILTWTIILGSILFCITGLSYYYLIKGYAFSERFALNYFNEVATNLVGIITIPGIIFLIYNIRKKNHIYVTILQFMGLSLLLLTTVMTQSRGTLIALLVSISLLMKKRFKIYVAISGLLLLIVLISPVRDRFGSIDSMLQNERVANYLTSLEIIRDYPIFGIGFGMQTFKRKIDFQTYYKRVPAKYKTEIIFNDPHNMLLSIAVRTGIIGLICFLYILFETCRISFFLIFKGKTRFIQIWALNVFAVFLAIFIIGQLEPIFSVAIEVIIYTNMALLVILYRMNQACPASKTPVAT